MEKAKYIGRSVDPTTIHGIHPVHLFYEYRGIEYSITDPRNGAIFDIRSEHELNQQIIDRIVDDPNRNTDEHHAEWRYEGSSLEAFDRLMDFFATGEWNDG